jgi:hypothetical protein
MKNKTQKYYAAGGARRPPFPDSATLDSRSRSPRRRDDTSASASRDKIYSSLDFQRLLRLVQRRHKCFAHGGFALACLFLSNPALGSREFKGNLVRPALKRQVKRGDTACWGAGQGKMS